MKKIILITTQILLAIIYSEIKANSLLQPANLTFNQLNSIQQSNYNRFIDSVYYDKYELVRLNDLFTVQSQNGIVNVSLPYFPVNSIDFKMNYVNRTSESTYFFYGQQPYDNEFISSTITYQKFQNFTLINIVINDEDWDIYDLGDGIGLLAHSNGIEGETICLQNSIESPNGVLPISEIVDPCNGAISKILVLYNDDTEQKYGYPCIATKAHMAVNQTNVIRMNSSNASKLLLVGVENLISFPQSNSIFNDIDDLANNIDANNDRNSFLADLVVLFVKKPYDNGAGKTYGIANSFGIADDMTFAIVNFKTSVDKKRTFAHEVHHMYDARHHDDMTGQNYSKAHCIYNCNVNSPCSSNNTHTVMWGCAAGKTLDYLSSPSKTYNGTPLGVANVANNAQRVEERDLQVALFRVDPPLPLYATLSILPFPQCELVSTANVKVECGTPPYTYDYQQSNDGVNFFNIAYLTSNSSSNNQLLALTIPANNGIYASSVVKVTVTDANNNSYTDTRSAHSWCKGNGTWTHSFPDEDDPNLPRPSIESNPLNSVMLYPNPVSDVINIDLSKTDFKGDVQLSIMDLNTKVLYTTVIHNKVNKVNIPKHLTSRLYIIKLKSNNEQQVRKITIK
jgi:hypothetical protein